MRKGGAKKAVLLVVFLSLFALVAVVSPGCGGSTGKGSGDYTEVVLDQWSGLEGDSEELVEAVQETADETDLEDYSELLADAEDNVGSFEDELEDLEVPSQLEESNEALEDFLSAYADYLKALRKSLDAVIAGEDLSYTADLDTPAQEAEDALEEYQDSQDYNDADLDQDIWDLPGYLGEAIVAVYGDVIVDDGSDVTDGQFDAALDTVDAWYYYFNQGDGETMWSLIDFESPMLEDFTYEGFLTFVGEAYAAGLQATYTVDDVQGSTGEDDDYAEVFLTVDYSELLGMEGETIPAHSEEVIIDLVYYEDGWYIHEVFSRSGIW